MLIFGQQMLPFLFKHFALESMISPIKGIQCLTENKVNLESFLISLQVVLSTENKQKDKTFKKVTVHV